MKESSKEQLSSAARKQDHIELTFSSQVEQTAIDDRFYYEPLLAAHPESGSWPSFTFLGKEMKAPLWVSSMTGGTELAKIINQNLARACRDFGMGMGLGSCRSLLYDDTYLKDFDVRDIIGDSFPLFANLGIAQVEKLLLNKEVYLVERLVDKLRVDGLIIHVNPFQEWLQPEGDLISLPPIETISRFLDEMPIKVIVKEVGQGMGYNSLKALFQLPLEAIDFAASGGTNFAKLELLRGDSGKQKIYSELALVGHSAQEMVKMTNKIIEQLGDKLKCKQVIISGGIKHFLDGFYLINKLNMPCVYGQASQFLKHARGNYDDLAKHVQTQIKGLELANAFLRVKK